MVRCFILRGFRTLWSHDQSFPNWSKKCEILTKPQQFEKWHLLIWMVQLVSGPMFYRDNKSVHKFALFSLEHLLHPKQWWEHQERLGNIFQWDGLTCTWTCFSSRIQIWGGKFQIPTRSPCMAVSKGVAEFENRWSAANGIAQLGPGPVLWGESRSVKGNLKFHPDHPVWLF